MTDLDALLQRVEAATGADEELDALIVCALVAPAGSRVEKSRFNGAWCIDEPRSYGKQPFGPWERCPRELRGKSVTASIDAAVALVERAVPGAEYQITNLYGVAMAELPLNMSRWQDPEVARREDGYMPLAILAALLRALIAQRQPVQNENGRVG